MDFSKFRMGAAIGLNTEHASFHEGVLQMQLVNAVHESQVDGVDLLGPIMNVAPAYADQRCLSLEGTGMIAVNHSFALSNRALVSVLSKEYYPAPTARSWRAWH
jgi:hypothetical protein